MTRRPPAVARVLERVTATIREHDMFSPGDCVLVAVSGGPDSTCLLYSLWMLRRLFKVRLEVFHFDHKLRPDSAKDARYVKRTAAKLELPFHLAEARSKPPKGESLEMWARLCRNKARDEVRRRIGAQRTATGHTMDDQAETVLLELIRGGGAAAFSGIRPAYMGVVRPLTDVRRSEVTAFCRSLGLRPRLDPTNRDTRFLRNAIRLRVIPAMEEATGRDVTEPIARSAALVRGLLDRIDPQLTSGGFDIGEFDDGAGRLSVRKLGWLPPQHAGEAVKWMLRTAGFDVSRAHVDAILDLVKGRPGRRVSLPGGFTAVREREYIRLSSPEDR